jgi:hypothetical protein
MDSVCIRTRQSLGSQLRETFDAMLAKDWIDGWKVVDGTTYIVERNGLHTTMNPGQAMAYANSYGFDVRFGKAS